MTTTTEAAVEQPDLLADASAAAEHAEASSLAVIRPEQQRFDENQRAILRQLGIEEATDGDLDLFFHVCRTTGLDPFRRQIYMIGRNTKVSEWVDDDRASNGRRKVERWVTKYTIQVGIDGYRRNVREAAKALGDTLQFNGPWFTAADDFHVDEKTGEVIQHWRKVWPHKMPPWAARFVCIRNGEPHEGIAHYDEFVQTNFNGEPNSMWAKMPRNQIAKCAEALAYRRAYPDDLSGLVLEDAAQPMIVLDEDGKVISERPRRAGPAAAPITVDEIMAEPESAPKRQRPAGASRAEGEAARERQQITEPAAEASAVDQPAEPPAPVAAEAQPEPETPPAAEESADDELPEDAPAKVKQLFALLRAGDITDREDRLTVFTSIAERPIGSTNDLQPRELNRVIAKLKGWQEAGTLAADLAELLWRQAAVEADATETTTEGN